MSSHSEAPTKEEVIQKLDSLIREELTRRRCFRVGAAVDCTIGRNQRSASA